MSEVNFQFCVPGGIGDISWVYSKIRHLKQITGHDVILYVAGQDKPNRGGDLVELLPDVKWGGYLTDRNSFNVISQSVPSEWPVTIGNGVGLLLQPGSILNCAANIHLEMGKPLSQWLPFLPTDYHYPLNIAPQHIAAANEIMGDITRPAIAVYLSNRSKEKQIQGGWNLWSTKQWITFLKKFSDLEVCEGLTFVFLGAEYDRDKTTEVAAELRACGHKVKEVIGKPLGVALECLRRSHYFFAFPSGIGILANVLRVPGVMLLPWLISGLEKAYADPVDMGNNRYKVWVNPKPEEVLDWVKNISLPMSWDWVNWKG